MRRDGGGDGDRSELRCSGRRILPREYSKFNIESIGENLIKLLPPEATRRFGFRPGAVENG